MKEFWENIQSSKFFDQFLQFFNDFPELVVAVGIFLILLIVQSSAYLRARSGLRINARNWRAQANDYSNRNKGQMVHPNVLEEHLRSSGAQEILRRMGISAPLFGVAISACAVWLGFNKQPPEGDDAIAQLWALAPGLYAGVFCGVIVALFNQGLSGSINFLINRTVSSYRTEWQFNAEATDGHQDVISDVTTKFVDLAKVMKTAITDIKTEVEAVKQKADDAHLRLAKAFDANIDKMSTTFSDQLNKITAKLDSFTKGIEESSKTVTSAGDQLKARVDQCDKDMNAAASTMTTFDDHFRKAFEAFDKSVDTMNATTSKVDQAVQTWKPAYDEALADNRRAMDDANQTLRESVDKAAGNLASMNEQLSTIESTLSGIQNSTVDGITDATQLGNEAIRQIHDFAAQAIAEIRKAITEIKILIQKPKSRPPNPSAGGQRTKKKKILNPFTWFS